MHYLSFVAFVGATAHGLMAGSDTSATWAYLGYLTIASLVLFLVTYRIILARGGAQERATRKVAPAAEARPLPATLAPGQAEGP